MNFFLNGLHYGFGVKTDGLYLLDLNTPVLSIQTKRPKISHESEAFIWHCRLGHINENRIKRLKEAGLLGQFEMNSLDTCDSCLLGKMTKAPFKKKGERANDLLGLVHSDVCGPLSINARGGYSYFVTFTDDFSRYGYVSLDET